MWNVKHCGGKPCKFHFWRAARFPGLVTPAATSSPTTPAHRSTDGLLNCKCFWLPVSDVASNFDDRAAVRVILEGMVARVSPFDVQLRKWLTWRSSHIHVLKATDWISETGFPTFTLWESGSKSGPKPAAYMLDIWHISYHILYLKFPVKWAQHVTNAGCWLVPKTVALVCGFLCIILLCGTSQNMSKPKLKWWRMPGHPRTHVHWMINWIQTNLAQNLHCLIQWTPLECRSGRERCNDLLDAHQHSHWRCDHLTVCKWDGMALAIFRSDRYNDNDNDVKTFRWKEITYSNTDTDTDTDNITDIWYCTQ